MPTLGLAQGTLSVLSSDLDVLMQTRITLRLAKQVFGQSQSPATQTALLLACLATGKMSELQLVAFLKPLATNFPKSFMTWQCDCLKGAT